MKVPSERVGFCVTLVLQAATLVAVLWVGVGLRDQTGLTATLIAQERAMSTTYTDRDGFSHTVQTPYGPTMADQHRNDLKASFCVFAPADPPSWWNPEEDCP